MEIIKKIFLLVLLSLSLFGAQIEWAEGYEEALEKAQKENKLLYVYISSTSCPWCAKFQREVLTDSNAIKEIQKDYIPVHLMKEMDDIPEGYSAKVIPRHYFSEANGKVFYTFAGYYDSADFIDTLKDIKEEREEKN